MPSLTPASPQLSVRLFKTIERKTIDGQSAVSARYQGKSAYIDLTPFLNDGSSVRTSKSVREPAGGFVLTFSDKPQSQLSQGPSQSLESVCGLVEPMDIVEIRMWSGIGPKPTYLPIIMRGFVSEIQRQQSAGNDGRVSRQVVVSGQDYGKIWQTFQVIYLAAYAEGKGLLTNFQLFELFGVGIKNSYPAGEFVQTMVQKVINPHLAGMMPEYGQMPSEIHTGDDCILVKHGVVNNSYQGMQGSIYDILRFHGDVGVWNELYTEDREDGVHCVYRPVPALHLTKPKGAKDRRIQDDAPEPIFVPILDSEVSSLSVARSDGNVANFFWVNNSRFDLIDDMQRKLASIPAGDAKVSLKEYPNTAVKYYGVRPMYAETQQGDDKISNLVTSQDKPKQDERSIKQEAWIDKRRRLMMEMNKDNVVLERGSARIKGGPMRPDGREAMKAGDYATFLMGGLEWSAYVTQIEHEFMPFQGYTTTLIFERGEGFATRTGLESGASSPWLLEQSSGQGYI